MWLLLMVGPVASAIRACCHGPWVDVISTQTLHPEWYGFVLWDIIMPLFMFMSGATIPFSMAKYKNGNSVDKHFYLKLIKRFCLMFVHLGRKSRIAATAFFFIAFFLAFANTLILFFILKFMYEKKIFLRA